MGTNSSVQETAEEGMLRLAQTVGRLHPEFLARKIQQGEKLVDSIIGLLFNPAAGGEGVLDPKWKPLTETELQTYEVYLDEALMPLFRPDAFRALRLNLIELNKAKGAVYHDEHGVDSCYQRGFFGLVENIARKWDRIDAVSKRFGVGSEQVALAEAKAESGKATEADAETLYVTFRDMAQYCILAMRYLDAMENSKTR